MPHAVTEVLGAVASIVMIARLAVHPIATYASLRSDKVARRYARVLAAKRSK